MKRLLIFALIQILSCANIARASTAFEDGVVKIEKEYFNKNKILLKCGVEVDACTVKVSVFGRKIEFILNFKKQGLKPDLSQISLSTANGVSNNFMMAFSVDCNEEGMKYYSEMNADSVMCYAVVRFTEGKHQWLGVQAVPTYEPRYYE